MKTQKIHIVGIYGSGKSTLAKQLGEMLKIKTYDLDEIKYKRKYDKIRSVAERKKIVKAISKKKSWISEGPWLDYALDLYKSADLVVFLEIPERTLYKRIIIRHFKRKMSGKNYFKHNLRTTLGVLKNVRRYFHSKDHFMTLKTHKDYIDKYARKVLVVKNKKDIEALIESLR
jgi:shikimate kinase